MSAQQSAEERAAELVTEIGGGPCGPERILLDGVTVRWSDGEGGLCEFADHLRIVVARIITAAEARARADGVREGMEDAAKVADRQAVVVDDGCEGDDDPDWRRAAGLRAAALSIRAAAAKVGR